METTHRRQPSSSVPPRARSLTPSPLVSSSSAPCVELLDELHATVRQLWSAEPSCDPASRTDLLARLGAVGESLDRIDCRRQFHPDEAVDHSTLQRLAREVEALAYAWPDVKWTGPLAA